MTQSGARHGLLVVGLVLLSAACGGGGGGGLTDAGPGADAEIDGGPCAPARPPVACRANSDCPLDMGRYMETCLAPGQRGRCGVACSRGGGLCVTDADCAPTEICFSYYGSPCDEACGPGSLVTRCDPRCTASSCETGFSCDVAGDGHCHPIPCGADYACSSHTTCQAGVDGGDLHGCVRAVCATDADCGCGGGCVWGRCYDSLGSCWANAG